MVNKLWVVLAICIIFPQIALAELRYSGSQTVGDGVLTAGAIAAFEAKTGQKLFSTYEYSGSGKGIEKVAAGAVDVAGASRALKPAEKKLGISSTTIGYDAIAVFVHKNNPVKNLTKEQLKGIFTGNITNWKEVGGKNAPINANTEFRNSKRATVETFQELVMDGAPYANLKEIDLPREQIQAVTKDENAVCTVSVGLLSTLTKQERDKLRAASVNGVAPVAKNVQSGAYIISRPLIIVSKGLPKGQQKEFISFLLSTEGQKIVSKNFVPVRKL